MDMGMFVCLCSCNTASTLCHFMYSKRFFNNSLSLCLHPFLAFPFYLKVTQYMVTRFHLDYQLFFKESLMVIG